MATSVASTSAVPVEVGADVERTDRVGDGHHVGALVTAPSPSASPYSTRKFSEVLAPVRPFACEDQRWRREGVA